MKMRLLLVILFLLLPIASSGVGRWTARGRGPVDVGSVPTEVGGLQLVRKSTLSEPVLAAINPEAYVMAQYGPTSRAWTYVAFYSGYGATGAHDPSVCYPSQGWVISELSNHRVELAPGEILNAKLFRANQGPQVELVLYWFQPSRRWPATEPAEWIWRVFDAVTGAKQYAFVRLSIPLSDTSSDHEQRASELLEEMARDLAPWARGILDPEPAAAVPSSTSSGADAARVQRPH